MPRSNLMPSIPSLIGRAPFWLIGSVSLLCALTGCDQNHSERSDSKPGQKVAASRLAIGLVDLDGQQFELWSEPGAPATVVVFTQIECPIANRYAPEIRRLSEKYHPQGVEFILVFVNPRDEPDAIRRHLREFDYPCRAACDPKHALVAHCRATATPEAVVFGKDRSLAYVGRIDDRYIDLGKPRDEPTTCDLADAIESTLRGRPIAKPRTKAVGCLIADMKD